MKHGRPKRPGDTTSAGRVWTDQGLARIGGDQPTCVPVAGQTVGSGNKGIAEAERWTSEAVPGPPGKTITNTEALNAGEVWAWASARACSRRRRLRIGPALRP